VDKKQKRTLHDVHLQVQQFLAPTRARTVGDAVDLLERIERTLGDLPEVAEAGRTVAKEQAAEAKRRAALADR
jgi:hypothetical protein